MSSDGTRDLLKALGDAVVPLEDADATAGARARAVPRLEASIRGAAVVNARRTRIRRVALAFGAAATLAIGVASAGAWLRSANPSPAPAAPPASPALETAAPVRAVAPAEAPAASVSPSASSEAQAAVDAPAASSHAEAQGAVPSRAAAPGSRANAAGEASTLAAQNQLLASALDAKRRGDDAKALVLLDELLRKYPTSPLAQDARVERLRCLQRLGRQGAAAAEARRYLADYPEGFAREEAKGQVLPAPSARPHAP